MIKGPPKPCAVPTSINMSGLLAVAAGNDCGCDNTTVLPVPADELAAFEAKARLSLSSASIDVTYITDPDQQAFVTKYWSGLVGAYRELYKRTCYRFHGCTLSARIATPAVTTCCCAQEIVCCCSSATNGYDITRIASVFDTAEYTEILEYVAGGFNRHPVDMPNRAPVPGAMWKIRVNDGLTFLSPQQQSVTDTLPSLPAQNMNLPAGVEGTSVLLVHFDPDFDPAFINAVYQLALLDIAKCAPSCRCGTAEDVSSVSDDGFTIGFAGGNNIPNTGIALQWRSLGFTTVEAIDDVLIRYQCEEQDAQFATTSEAERSWVAEWFWSTTPVIPPAINTGTGTAGQQVFVSDLNQGTNHIFTFTDLQAPLADVEVTDQNGNEITVAIQYAGNTVVITTNQTITNATITATGVAA